MRRDIGYLKKIPVFADLGDDALLTIHQYSIERTYRRGTVIFFAGDRGEGFHYLKSGRVKIVRASGDGHEHIIKLIVPGEVFAEVLLFNNQPYPATAIAADDVCVGVIKNSDLERLVLSNNKLALQLIKALSQRLLYAQEKIKNLALDDVLARTADTLLRLGREQGRRGENGAVVITVDLTRQDLASLIGTTRETVTRTLGTLKRDDIIDLAGDDIVILKPEKLKTFIE
jgi:CRP/FNR family transcriptional regulator